ncbi:MAG: response regulator [Oligoflexus sp.]
MNKWQILLAEDDSDVAETLKESLEDAGYHVVEIVSRGEDLVHAANQHNPDLIVCDIYLEGNMDGITAAAPIAHRSKPPIIFLTGNFTMELIASLRDFQNSMLLYKPCKLPELIANIEMAMKRQDQGQTPFASLFSNIDREQTEDFRRQLGQLIKSARRDFQLTQANAAEKLSINYRYFQDIEAGKANLKIDTLFKIIKGLNLVDD